MSYLGNRHLRGTTRHSLVSTNILLTINDRCANRDIGQWFKNLKKIGVDKIVFFGDFQTIADFLKEKKDEILASPHFEYSILFRPDVSGFLQENIQKIDSYLLPHLFCNKAYFKRHALLTKEVFHFFETEPEIYPLKSKKKITRLTIKNPQDVDSVFLISGNQGANIHQEVTEITEQLNPTTGILTLNTQNLNKGKIVVLRRYFFDAQRPLSHFFNYYDATAFAALQKWFKGQMLRLPAPVSGVVYNLEEMFDVSQQFNGVSYSENLEKVLKGIKKTIAFYYASGQNLTIHNIFLSIVFKRYFNSMLRPRFNILSPQVQYLIHPDSSLAQLLDLNHQFILNLDVDQFETGTPYYWKTISSLKRAESQLFAETNGALPVLAHRLLDSPFSIPEQKLHIDLLAQAGATQFWWREEIGNAHIPVDSMNFIEHKIKYANQLGAFLSRGLPVGRILMLYPSLDQRQDAFQKILEDLHFSGINFELVNFDLFNSNQYCKIEDGKINFNQKNFSLILLPAVQIIPFLTLKKLMSFFSKGGQIAAIQKVPSQVELRDKQSHFEKMRNELWMVEPDLKSITFLQNDAGGKSWFIPRLKLLRDFLSPYVQKENVYVDSERSEILVRIRETQEAFFVFLTNPNRKKQCRLTLHSDKKAFPFYWDFKKQIQKPLHHWGWHDAHLTVPLTLWPMESRLIILQKELSTDVWHIGRCNAEDCHVFSPRTGTFVVQVYNQQPGPVDLTLEKGEKSLKVPVHIREKLNPLFLSPDHWILITEEAKQMIHLDDLPKIALTLKEPPILQKTFVLRKFRRDQSYYLDLGSPNYPCIVKINGQTGGTLWHHPFKVDISALLQAGENILEIRFAGTPPQDTSRALANIALPDPVRLIPYQKIFIQAGEVDKEGD